MAKPKVTTLKDLDTVEAGELAGIQTPSAGDDHWSGIGQGQKLCGGNDTGSRENAGRNDTCSQKAEASGQGSRSMYNISGTILGAGMVGLVEGGTNTVSSSPDTPGKKKPEISQEAVGGNAKDGQEAVDGNAAADQKADGRNTGAVYNISPQIVGAGIAGVVRGGTNTVEHFPVPQGKPVKDNMENDKGDHEDVGGNNNGGGKSISKNV